MWVLGIEHRSSGRLTSAQKYRTISPALKEREGEREGLVYFKQYTQDKEGIHTLNLQLKTKTHKISMG